MKALLVLLAFAFAPLARGAVAPPMRMPEFPRPTLVLDEFGQTKAIGFLRFCRELEKGGVQGLDEVEFSANDYTVLRSDSLATMAAWLETACHAMGLELPQARTRRYDGAVYARLLEVAASLAVLRERGESLAMPVGVLVCQRRLPWGDLPGDGERDCYVLVETERGLLIYDPPTRQLSELGKFPNTPFIRMIQF